LTSEPEAFSSDPAAAIELPSVHMAVLNADEVRDLFRDLSLVARILEVRVKGHPTAYGSTTPWTLVQARDALAARSVSGIQIRYAHQADVWCDTLMHSDEGVRLVRIKDPASPTTTSV
jgi:hypothetical protein